MKAFIKLLFLLCPVIYFSQGTDYLHDSLPVVHFNFKKPSYIRIPKTLKEGDFYRIHVKGVNLNQYAISLKASDTVYSKALTFPTFGSIDLSNLKNLLSSSIVESTIADSENQEEAKQLTEELKTVEPFTNKSFPTKARICDRLLSVLIIPKVKPSKRELVENQILKNSTKFIEYVKDLEIAKKAIDDKKFEYMEYRILRKTEENNPDSNIDIKEDLRGFENLRTSLNKLEKSIKKAKESSINFVNNTEKIKAYLNKPKNIRLKEKFEKSEKELDLTLKKTNEILKTITTDKIEKIIISIMNLYKNNDYKSLPIQFNGEEAKVEMFFIPKDSTSNLQHYSLLPVKFPKKKKYWSVGTSMYYSGMKSARVGYKTIVVNDSVSVGKLSMEKDIKGEIGTALLLRGGKKFHQNCGYHFAVGTGISISDEVSPRALIGGGLSFGEKHNFNIDTGFSIGNVKEVSKSADFNIEYKEQPSVLINQVKISYFFAIGYSYQL